MPGTDFSKFEKWHVTYLRHCGVYEGGETPLVSVDEVEYIKICCAGSALWLADGQPGLLRVVGPEPPALPPSPPFVVVLELLRRQSLENQERGVVVPY